jgi:hypothetical protein
VVNDRFKSNWNGELINYNQPWYDETLFNVGDFPFTVENTLYMTGAIIGITFCVTLLCCMTAYKKKNTIIHGTKRLGESLRASIKGSKKTVPLVDDSSELWRPDVLNPMTIVSQDGETINKTLDSETEEIQLAKVD